MEQQHSLRIKVQQHICIIESVHIFKFVLHKQSLINLFCRIQQLPILQLKFLLGRSIYIRQCIMDKKQYRVIGMMSGTSLDGIDLAFCTFIYDNQWEYELISSKTYQYPQQILELIFQMQNESTTFLLFKKAEIKYSLFVAQTISSFMKQNLIENVDFVSLHGHTIFHKPSQRITIQAGNLNTISAELGISVIGNFRQYDVMKGGEGAPLVPYGEELFGNKVFLNLGGVSNIGYKRLGWDINYCNLFFNHFAFLTNGSQFDLNGQLGRKGKINIDLKQYIEENYKNGNHLSMGREGFETMVKDLNQNYPQTSNQDILYTFYHFLSEQINRHVQNILGQKQQGQVYQVFCTGGGSKNTFLFELLSQGSLQTIKYVKPNEGIVDFKEAIIFAFLGNCSRGIGGMQVKGQHM